jgi:hypothetical protein
LLTNVNQDEGEEIEEIEDVILWYCLFFFVLFKEKEN